MQTSNTGPSRANVTRVCLLRMILLLLPLLCSAEARQMPALNAKTLNGETVKVPGNASGKPTVLIFGFAQSARNQSETWGRALIQWQRERDNFSFFQVAMLSGAPRFTHGLIRRAIRASVPPAYHPHMLLSAANGKQWMDLLDVTDSGSAYVILCNPAGRIQWQTKGAGRAQFEALRNELRRDTD